MQDTLLIVDNDESILRCLSLMFKEEFKICTAGSAREALEIAKQTKVDCIISDFDMDEGNGMFLLKNLENQEIPFILITGHGEKDLYKSFANERTFHIFEKPLNTTIRSVVHRAIAHYHHSQKQLKESLLGKNTAHILHDINNGLAIIQGSADAGLRTASSEFSKYFLMSQKGCDRISTVISKYKAFMSNAEEIQFSKIKVNPFIRSLLDECRETIAKNISFEFEGSQFEEVEVSVDPDLFRQVLLNLISNSVDESRNHSSFMIKLILSNDKNNLVVSVQDSGSVTDEVAVSLFKEGFSTKREKGTGMGLSYCHQLLQKMNATIFLTSKSPTTFSIYLNN